MEEILPIIFLVAMFAIAILTIISMWIVFQKAGKPGWASIIPIYNLIVLLEICGKPLWWILLMFIPLVSIIVAIIIFIALAKSFGKSELYGVGLALFGFVFFPMLAFGDAKYIGPQS